MRRLVAAARLERRGLGRLPVEAKLGSLALKCRQYQAFRSPRAADSLSVGEIGQLG